MFDTIVQISIIFLGGFSIILALRKSDKVKGLGCLFGILSEIPYFITSYKYNQWGVLVLCAWYSVAWLDGIRRFWFPQIKFTREKHDEEFK